MTAVLLLLLTAALVGFDLLGRRSANSRSGGRDGRRPLRLRLQKFDWDLYAKGLDRHAIPLRDGQFHVASPECPCAPGDAPLELLDRTFGQLYTHHQTHISTRQ